MPTCVLYPAPYILYPVPYAYQQLILYPVPCAPPLGAEPGSPCACGVAFIELHPAPYALCPMPSGS